jgi:cobalt/nickel transport system ATP-binding protein
MREGRIVADGETRTMLADAPLLAENRLELPYGFELGDPRRD